MLLLRPTLWPLVVLALATFIHETNQVPIKTADYIANLEAKSDECVLPGALDFSGRISHIEDCPSLDRFHIPIPIVPYGNVPRVCCPKELGPNPICFPSDPWCPTYEYEEFSYEDYDDYNYDGEQSFTVSNVSFVCASNPNSECVPLDSCGNVTGPEVNLFCGFETDQIKVCCQTDQILENPPPKLRKPRFLNSGKPYPCQDKSPHCKKWAANGACDLERLEFPTGELSKDEKISSLNMFSFMNLACQESCGWCGAKGCVDELSECEAFARDSYCDKDHLFMGQTCRESCGVCGFLSPENTEEQTMGTNSYSNIEDSSFDCGRYKSLEDLKNAGIQIQQDQFPNKTELNDVGECSSEDYSTGDNVPAELKVDNSATADNFGLRDIYDDENDDDLEDTSLGNTASDALITCGLIIISDRWMLSAAHCYDLYYRTGEIRVSQVRAYLPEFKEFVLQKRIFVHPNYESPQLYNDIALIELGKRIIFNYDVLGDTPTCLSSSFDFDEKIASVTGWGKTEEGEGSAGKKLGTVNITLTNYQTCNQNLSSYVQAKTNKKLAFCTAMPNGILDQNICGRGSPLCSLGEKVYPGSCKGDSGGPVEVEVDGKRTLVGLVSGSINCNSPMPEWYTRVAYFRDWILCIMNTAKGNKLGQKEIENRCKQFVTETGGQKSSYCDEN